MATVTLRFGIGSKAWTGLMRLRDGAMVPCATEVTVRAYQTSSFDGDAAPCTEYGCDTGDGIIRWVGESLLAKSAEKAMSDAERRWRS